MIAEQGRLAQRRASRPGLHVATHFGGTVLSTAVKLPARLAVRAVFGKDTGPRGAKRERFPECQWQEILAGKRKWFD